MAYASGSESGGHLLRQIRVSPLALPGGACQPPKAVVEGRAEQLGTMLNRMAKDLVASRRRVAELERENRELRAKLDALTGERERDQSPARMLTGPSSASSARRRK